MKFSRYEEGLVHLSKLLTGKPLKFQTFKEHSLSRLLLVGLIFPAIIITATLATVVAALAMGISAGVAFLTVVSTTMVAFAGATALMIKISRRVVEFARVKKRK